MSRRRGVEVNESMSRAARFLVAPSVVLLALAGLLAQTPSGEDRPRLHVPVKKPTQQDLDHAEALKLFGLAAIHERDNRLIEALKTYEEALRFDPEAIPVLHAIIPLYIAIDRSDDVFKNCERVLELDPDDFDTGYLYARQLRAHERSHDALKVLTTLVGRPLLKDSPDLHARVCYDLGLLHETGKEWTKAITMYRTAAEILDHPAPLLEQGAYTKEELADQAAETYEHLGRVYLKQNKTRDAVAAFEKAQARDHMRAPRLAYNLAEVLINEGELADALPHLDEYLRSQPQGMEGYEMKIQLLRKLNRSGDILSELETAAGRDPHNPALQLLLAREYRQAKQAGKAEAIYVRLIQERPTTEVYRELFALLKAEGAAGVARVLEMLDDAVAKGNATKTRPADEGAAARGRSMLAVLREDGDLVKKLLSAVGQRMRNGESLDDHTGKLFAGLATRTRQLDLAERLFRGCLHAGGRQEEHEQDVYVGLLQVLQLAHKNQAVVDVCREGLKEAQKTNRVVFHLDMAQALMNLNQVKEALASADDAVNDAGAGDRLMCRRVRAGLLAQAEKYEQAIAECQSLLKEYNLPGEVRDIRYTLSSVYSSAKENAKSEEQLRLILDADSGDAGANNDLGYLLADRNKNLPEAEAMIRKAMELERKRRREGAWVGIDSDLDNAAYVDSLGWVLFRRGELKAAREELDRAIQLPGGGDDPVVWDHLGDVCFRQGQKAKAQEAWKKALELYEAGQRRRSDDHYRELKQKLRQAP
jgi:tetratricopeptide (TPR) repeat protein